MKKITLLLVAVLMLCVLASCNPNKGLEEKEEVIKITSRWDPLTAILENDNGTMKRRLSFDYDNKVSLQIWTKNGINQKEYSEEPDVTYKGSWTKNIYEKSTEETESCITHYRTTCMILKFTDCIVPEDIIDTAKQSYEDQMSLYSGAFDIELVTYKEVISYAGNPSNCPLHGDSTGYNYRAGKGDIMNFVVTKHPEYDRNQSYVIGDNWKVTKSD